MNAILTPLWFTAHGGLVCFEGRQLSEFAETRAGVAIRRAGLNAPHPEAWVYHVAHEQLFAAQAEARKQRRKSA